MRGKLGGVLAFILLCTGILYARYTFQIYKEEVFLGEELIENKEEVKNLIRDEIEKRDELQTNVVLENVQEPVFGNVVVQDEVEEPEERMQDRYYYDQLNSYAKIIYARLTNEYENMKTGTAKIDFGKEFNSVMQTEQGKKEIEDSFQAALNALFYDRPEYFFLESTKMFFYTETTTRGTKTTYETYIAPAENENYLKDIFENEIDVNVAIRRMENITKDIVLEAGASKYDIIKNAHDWIVMNTQYDETLSEPNIRDIYGVFENGVAVCAGYANAFKYILDRAGISCIYVPGDATNEKGTESHAWNYVKINDKWYFVDCTWDDPIITGATYLDNKIRTEYFLKGRNTVENSHVPNNNSYGEISFEWPELYELDYKK